MAVIRIVALYSLIEFTYISEVLPASIIRTIAQKAAIFIFAVVRTWNLECYDHLLAFYEEPSETTSLLPVFSHVSFTVVTMLGPVPTQSVIILTTATQNLANPLSMSELGVETE
jgi:hypothetical protein